MAALTTHSETRSPLRRRSVDLLVNLTVLGVLWFGYAAVRGVTRDDLTVAMDNARVILEVQELLGLPSELGLQQLFLDSAPLVKAANIYYIAVHFPLTIAFLAWVWLRHRQRFDRVRNTLIAVTGAGLIIHLAYPLAPPRMINGFVDTAAVFGPSPYDLSISQAANQIAAMPSLHVGWAMIVALGVISILSSPWRWIAVAHPAITLGVVVMTANHYWLDAAVAIALVITGWLLFARYDLARRAEVALVVEDSPAWPHVLPTATSTPSNTVTSRPPMTTTAADAPSTAREPAQP